MSAVWLTIAAVFCVGRTATAEAGMNKVQWKEVGKSITIPCKTSADMDMLHLTKGLDKKTVIFFTEKKNKKINVLKEMEPRVQVDMKFPNVEILIKNLSVSDTGLYWCLYSTYSGSQSDAEAEGILLVVTDKKHKPTEECQPSHLNLIITIVVAVATTLLCFLLLLIIWMKQKPGKPFCRSEKPSQRINNNDVYEDMRGTIRR